MQLRRTTSLAVLLLCIPLGGADCELINNLLMPPTDDGGMPEPEGCVDENYSIETAGTIAPGMVVDEYLCPIRDNDFWAFSVEGTAKLVRVHLWMDTNLTPVEPSYTIITDADVPTGISGEDSDRTPGEAVDFEGLHPIAAGDYVLRITDVEGFDDRFDDANPYHLEIEILDNPDPSEPNENPDEATPLTLDATTTGVLGTTDDHDWFSVPVEADAQLLDLQFRAPGDIGLDLRVEVVAPDGLTIIDAQGALDNGMDQLEVTSRRAVSGEPGTTYFIHVFDDNGNANADTDTGTYELVVTVSPDPDVNEQNGGNDLVEDATPLAPDTPMTATLASAGDQDMYEVEVPNASPGNPSVLVVELSFSGGVPADIQPQLQIITLNPERTLGQLPACDDSCSTCLTHQSGEERCGEPYLQRVLTGPDYTAGFPIRRRNDIVIAVNDFGDDGYLDGNDYTLTYRIVGDPDPGEQGDDYLIPNLQTASYDNEEELENQYNRSRERARSINVPFQAACEPPEYDEVDGGIVVIQPPDPCADAGVADPDAGPDGGGGGGCVPPPPPNCQEVAVVPSPQGAPLEPFTVVCDGQDWTVSASGRLTYEGDRDFFTFNVPDVGYWGMDVDYDVSVNTPVELTVFFHDSEKLIGAFLEATETQGNCITSTDCPAGSVCIDETCWADVDNNNAFTGHTFPNAGQCLYVHTNFTQRPLFVEVTDNGINDFDLDMEYTIDVRIRCGCPADCDNTGPVPQCQGVAAP